MGSADSNAEAETADNAETPAGNPLASGNPFWGFMDTAFGFFGEPGNGSGLDEAIKERLRALGYID